MAINLLCEIPDISTLNSNKSLVAFAGIDPVIKESGKRHVKFSISKKGDRHLRRTLFIMSMNIVRYEGKFRDFFLRLRERGKPYMVAIIAVANKLLKTLFPCSLMALFILPIIHS